MKHSEKLKNFLEEKDVYKRFRMNFYSEQLYQGNFEDIFSHLTDVNPEWAVSGFFTWDKSPEGQDFWSEINDGWKKILNN